MTSHHRGLQNRSMFAPSTSEPPKLPDVGGCLREPTCTSQTLRASVCAVNNVSFPRPRRECTGFGGQKIAALLSSKEQLSDKKK